MTIETILRLRLEVPQAASVLVSKLSAVGRLTQKLTIQELTPIFREMYAGLERLPFDDEEYCHFFNKLVASERSWQEGDVNVAKYELSQLRKRLSRWLDAWAA